jgi:ABC-type transport system involved in multi-copper enzyme maturation permease subunit
MNGSMVPRLVLKDLYLTRWMVAASMAGGAVAIAMLPFGSVAAYVGGVSLICTLVILNITVVMSAVVQERKDKVLLFVLSLPVSAAQQIQAKALATSIAFVVPWLLLTAATAVVIDGSRVPNGILPFLVTVLVYLLAYHWVLLAVALVTETNGWPATVITVGNISVNLLIPYLLGWPSVYLHIKGSAAIWTSDLLALIVVELLVGIAALGLAIVWQRRRPDVI